MEWVYVPLDWIQRWALVYKGRKFRDPYRMEIFDYMNDYQLPMKRRTSCSYIKAAEICPLDGEGKSVRGFFPSAYCCIPLQSRLVYFK
jgi:hypothetical protein